MRSGGRTTGPRELHLDISFDDVAAWLDKAWQLRVLVIGEPILDEYVFSAPVGKCPKDSIMGYEWLRIEQYEGGASVIAGHLRAICANVRLQCGGIEPIVKRRYVLEPYMTKVFEIAGIAGGRRQPKLRLAGSMDMILVADYGHGLIRDGAQIQSILDKGGFLTLMVQTNSMNYGFNLLTKWPRADYVVCDEDELRLACQDKETSLLVLAQEQRQRFGASMLAVTLGHKGCLICDAAGEVSLLGMAQTVVDRMGAGDAFLAASAPMACLGAPKEIVALVGSVAAALKVETLGNKPIEHKALRERLGDMLSSKERPQIDKTE